MNNRSFKIMIFVYILLAFFVMLPLFAPGFILTLDMVFVPHPQLPEYVTSSYLFHAALHYLSYVIPGDVLQKIILLGILLGSGIGMHRLMQYLHDRRAAAYFAGIFYMVNPFVYARFMSGQYAVLLGYALLPFFALALLKFLKQPSLRSVAPVAAWTLAISIVSIHTLGLLVLFSLVALAVHWWRKHDQKYVINTIKYGLIATAAFFVFSSYWLVPTLLGQSRTAESISSFSATDHQAFATDGGLFTVLQLQGFWVEAQGLFKPAGDLLPLSGLWQLCLWVLIVIGFITAWRHHRQLAVIFGITGIIAALLALGGPINQFLADNVPFFAGYREPHKFAALLALAYAFFGAWGVVRILEVAAKRKQKYLYAGVSAFLLALPLLVTPNILWGFGGQLRPTDYPSDWYAMNERLPRDEKVLFLPWHLYMNFSFSGRIVANPADKFFDAPIISSNNPEFARVSQLPGLASTKIDREVLPQAPGKTNLGAALQPLGISYILLAKEGDYEDYAYLGKQTDIKLIGETATLKLYQVVAFKKERYAND